MARNRVVSYKIVPNSDLDGRQYIPILPCVKLGRSFTSNFFFIKVSYRILLRPKYVKN